MLWTEGTGGTLEMEETGGAEGIGGVWEWLYSSIAFIKGAIFIKLGRAPTTDIIFIDYFSLLFRSEERRVGKECRSRWSPYH